MIQAGVATLLAADSGAGKTKLLVLLLLLLSAYGDDWALPGGQPLTWWGQPVMAHAAGCKVLLITSEDDQQEIRRRLRELGKEGLFERAMTEGRFRIVTLVNNGGAFAFMQKQNTAAEPVPSQRWAQLKGEIERFKPDVVMVDTLSSVLHGLDVDQSVIQGFFNEMNNFVCGELGATLIVTHHTRKGSAGEGRRISTLEDMKDAVRGSTALLASVRCALGFFHPQDWAERMQALDLEPKPGRLYIAGVLKANSPEHTREVLTILQDSSGGFVDMTAQAKAVAAHGVAAAWMVAAVARAAKDRAAFCIGGDSGLFARRDELPSALQKLGKHPLQGLAKRLVKELRLAQVRCADRPQSKVLDVPGFSVEGRTGYQDNEAWSVNWEREYFYDPKVAMVLPVSAREAAEVADSGGTDGEE